jgi:hypothetical protein
LILAYQTLEEGYLDHKSPGPPGWSLMQQASPCSLKKKIAKRPIGNTLDRCNLRRHKLRKYSKNCLGEIIRSSKGLKQDIMVLTETKKKEME